MYDDNNREMVVELQKLKIFQFLEEFIGQEIILGILRLIALLVAVLLVHC